MIGVDVRHNLDRVEARLRMLGEAAGEKATVRALNRALDQTATAASGEIRKVYNIKHRAVLAAMKKIRAGSNKPWATLRLQGARINLIEFSSRAVNPWNVKGRRHNKRGGGVSVQIKVGGGRKLLKGAFIAASSANNYRGGGSAGMRQVWRRTAYQFGLGGTRTNRAAATGDDAIINLRSISIPQAFANQVVLTAVKRVANESFLKNLQQQIKYLGSK